MRVFPISMQAVVNRALFIGLCLVLILAATQLTVRSLASGSDEVTCAGQLATLVGTAGDDVLIGTAEADVIVGLEGNDEIRGEGGDDILCGGAGDDQVFGGPGADNIMGDAGADRLFGQGGDDRLHGGAGDDYVRAGRGNDRVLGAVGDDVLFGMLGADIVNGGPGNDQVYGGDAADTVIGGRGDDIVRGDWGNDVVRGDDGNDILLGSQGRDRLSGGAGDDRLAGMGGADVLSGGGGRDRLEGGKAADQLLGGPGADEMIGGAHADDCVGGPGVDVVLECESGDVDGPVGEPGDIVSVGVECVGDQCGLQWAVEGPPIEGARIDLAFGPCSGACEAMVEASFDFDRIDFEATFPAASLSSTVTTYCAIALSDYPEQDGHRSSDTFATTCGTMHDGTFVADGEHTVLNFGSMAITEPEVVGLSLNCALACTATVAYIDRTEGEDAVSVTVRNRHAGGESVVGFEQVAGVTPGTGTQVDVDVFDIAFEDLTAGELCSTVASVNQEFGGGRTSSEFCVAWPAS